MRKLFLFFIASVAIIMLTLGDPAAVLAQHSTQPDEVVNPSDSIFISWVYFFDCSCHRVTFDEDNITHIFVGPFISYCVTRYPEPFGNQWIFAGGDYSCTPDECANGIGEAMFIPNPELGNWVTINGNWYRHFELTITQPGCIRICADFPLSGGHLDCWLPVELLSFEAISGNHHVTLEWSTASETDNDRFEIVRDGHVVEAVSGHNGTTRQDYSWVDDRVENGITYSYTLQSVSVSGTVEELATVTATPQTDAAIVTEYKLRQNYPNPFNPTTQVSFDLLESGFVTLKLYNLMGQEVKTLVNSNLDAGQHSVTLDAADLPSGIYLYRLTANNFTAERKMVLIK